MVIGVVWLRKRKTKFVGEVLEAREVPRDSDSPEEVRSFLEAVLEGYPHKDVRLLAAARRRERSEEEREELTRMMRELL